MHIRAAETRSPRRLRGETAVEQIAPFGNTLHVVGRDGAGLERAVNKVATETGTTAVRAETSLEDVFIRLMGAQRDNMS